MRDGCTILWRLVLYWCCLAYRCGKERSIRISALGLKAMLQESVIRIVVNAAGRQMSV